MDERPTKRRGPIGIVTDAWAETPGVVWATGGGLGLLAGSFGIGAMYSHSVLVGNWYEDAIVSIMAPIRLSIPLAPLTVTVLMASACLFVSGFNRPNVILVAMSFVLLSTYWLGLLWIAFAMD